MKISIIIPVYNSTLYLKQCVESILAQTYHNFEILLVDDGSTDASGEICDKVACIDKRYNLEISSKNDFLLFLYLLGVVLTTSVPIFYRLSQFFLIFPIVYMTNAFSSFFRIKSQGLKCLMLICCIFFLYAHVGRFFRLSPDSGERLLVRVYPYSNVFTKEKDRYFADIL